MYWKLQYSAVETSEDNIDMHCDAMDRDDQNCTRVHPDSLYLIAKTFLIYNCGYKTERFALIILIQVKIIPEI